MAVSYTHLTPIVFHPDSVHSNLLTKKDDTLTLEVYTNEEYQKKIKRSQAWAMALYGISAGINAGTDVYKRQKLTFRRIKRTAHYIIYTPSSTH